MPTDSLMPNRDMLARDTQHTTYGEYVRDHQRRLRDKEPEEDLGSMRLWRQMTIGFIGAACVGLVMLGTGSAFIAQAIRSGNSVAVMLTVIGIVCGLIIVAGTAILGKLWISRKWRVAHGQVPAHRPPQQCFHTCSVIHTPSQEQLANTGHIELPPAYETIMMTDMNTGAQPLPNTITTETDGPIPVAMPPKYTDVNLPLPSYGESV